MGRISASCMDQANTWHQLMSNLTSSGSSHVSISVSMPACHAGELGSIPRRGSPTIEYDCLLFTIPFFIRFCTKAWTITKKSTKPDRPDLAGKLEIFVPVIGSKKSRNSQKSPKNSRNLLEAFLRSRKERICTGTVIEQC